MASAANITESSVKTNRKVLKATHRERGESVNRYFDFSIHAERTEFVRHTSWAMRNGVELTVKGVYVE